MPSHEKLVVITKKTPLEELVERFNTREQARFYLEQMGVAFDDYQAAHDAYQRAKETLKSALPQGLRSQWIDRDFLPTFTFGSNDLVVTLGPDGLVVNTAKYLDGQPLLAFNPDSERIDGVLLPFAIWQKWQVEHVLKCAASGAYQSVQVTMAQASLNDGQTLLALNDLFIGAKSHVSARYELGFDGQREAQSSSGIIVTTGAGSTGWWRSILTGAKRIAQEYGAAVPEVAVETNLGRRLATAPQKDRHAPAEGSPANKQTTENYRFNWSADELRFAVREPFISKTSRANLVTGALKGHATLEIVSQMPQNGVIFSDGVEEDFLEFNAGAIATIGVAAKKLRLITSV